MANKSRPKQLSFRVNEQEWELLQQKIAESGTTQQDYILSCVLGKEIKNTDGIKEIVPELKRQGANLNQLVKKIAESGTTQQDYILSCVLGKEIKNTDGIKEIVPELKRQGANLNQLVKKLNERGFIDYKRELPDTLNEVRAVWQLLRQYLQKQE